MSRYQPRNYLTPEVFTMYRSILLTDQDMTDLDDNQEWYLPGDTVRIGCYLPDVSNSNPGMDLNVNGATACDNWLYWQDAPANIRERLLQSVE